jgi:hypothetical protein
MHSSEQLFILQSLYWQAFQTILLKFSIIKGFVRLKQLVVSSVVTSTFATILARQGLGNILKVWEMEEKNFVGIEKRLNLSSYKTL